MDNEFMFFKPNEKPLEHYAPCGGYTSILRNIAVIGDSLASGEFQTRKGDKDWNFVDMYEYSWGRFLSRECGVNVYNFSEGGMTAFKYLNGFADEHEYFDKKYYVNAYIFALGVNDLVNSDFEVGSIKDIDLNDYNNNKPTFAGYYGKIVQKYIELQPDAKLFFVTMPRSLDRAKHLKADKAIVEHNKLMYDFTNIFKNSYVIDLFKYAPDYDDKEFVKNYFLFGHMSPAGYLLTAKMIASYIDYIIRHNFEDFKQVALMNTKYYNKDLNEDK